MKFDFERKTVTSPFQLIGTGIHSGNASSVSVSSGDRGIWFHHEGREYEAVAANVTSTRRCTTLGTCQTIEHLMSALIAHEITDAEITLSGSELPMLDGGSLEYSRALQNSGTRVIGKRTVSLFGRTQMHDGDQRISIAAGRGRWRYEFRSRSFPGDLHVEFLADADDYTDSIAPARTWCFERELEAIRAAGLGRGGTEMNTLIIAENGYRNPARFPDEPARHKLLDCMGDLALARIPLRCLDVVAEATGHEMHVRAAARLAELCNWEVN